MSQSDHVIETLDSRGRRGDDRRAFFTAALGAAAVGAGALTLATPASAQALTDVDVLNLALNLEYLKVNFYGFAANGAALAGADIAGTGTAGAATGGRQVAFSDPLIAAFAKEMAADQLARVKFLRTALGTSTVAQSAIDLGTTPAGAFSTAMRAAGLIGAGASFDPYANDENFLLAAFLFGDLGVTAYRGLASLIASKTFLEAIGGMLAADGYNAANVRSRLYRRGVATPSLIDAVDALSDYRDSLDGGIDLDQGIRAASSAAGPVANIAPLDGDGIVFSRSPGQVLNILFLNRAAVTTGGFFPSGVNGTIKTSAAS